MENKLVQLRIRLQERGVKLWESPYYVEDLGSSDSAVELLAQELSRELHITVVSCKNSLLELQEHSLRKLAARREFDDTGLATFHVRCVDNQGGTAHTLEVKCALGELGSNLQRKIADKLQLSEADHVKCISAGRMVVPQATLKSQGLKNNQQLLVIVGQPDARGEALYERIRQIQRDVEVVVDSDHRFVDLEDQDGNVMFLPPHENRALLMGMSLGEKARAAMRRGHYDEALLLFLEADEKFNNCDSKFLDYVDNYALLNLDIVWCYLCLKNITQLPDAQRRLDVCERILQRSYGENFSRLYALKGSSCPERALIMRLQLLQGVILFHQNQRVEARARLEAAGTALAELKVNSEQLELLVEMGFDASAARLALRSSNGSVEQAVQFIQQRRQRLQAARANSDSERQLSRRLAQMQLDNDGRDWVHPRSVCRLMDLGYEQQLVVEALRRTENDLARSLELLQYHSSELRQGLPDSQAADEQMLGTLRGLGFKLPAARAALEITCNNLDRAIDFLLKSLATEEELNSVVERMSAVDNAATAAATGAASTSSSNAPATSALPNSSSEQLSVGTPSKVALVKSVLNKAKTELETYRAYRRFNEDIPDVDQDYLDLPLEQEEQLLNEYTQLLEH
ncbi:NEDD8 ultimate buster 1-like [Drosophila virilis]|nr:NEDD8 ultimate buster 1 [Drosophila virilis]